MYYTILYLLYRTGWSRERQPPRKLQDFNSGSCKLNCNYTRPNAGPGGGSPAENCKISTLGIVKCAVYILNYTMLYYTILYRAGGPESGSPPENSKLSNLGHYTIQYRARGLRGSSSLENWKISILGVVDYIVFYYIVLHYTILTIPHRWSRERQRPRKLLGFSSGSCKPYAALYYIMLYYTILDQVRVWGVATPRKTARFQLWE